MNNNFYYDRRLNAYPLKIITQIDAIDSDDIAELGKLLLIDKDSIDISEVPLHVLKKYGLKVLIAYEYYKEPVETNNVSDAVDTDDVSDAE